MRQVFENVAQSGFGSLSQGRTVESITFSSTRLFAGTSDGAILQAEMKPESPQFQNSPHVFCASLQTLRPPGRDRRAAASLKCVESWRVLLCIVDSTVNVYNLHALGSQPPTELHETKGCLMYSISEQTNMLCVVSKRKLSFFALKGKAAFAHTGDLALPETPRMVFASDLGVVVGFRKSFDYIDFDTMQQTRLVDGDKDREGKCTATELPATEFRGACLLLGRQLQGKLVDKSSLPRSERVSAGGGDDGGDGGVDGGSSAWSKGGGGGGGGSDKGGWSAALGSAMPMYGGGRWDRDRGGNAQNSVRAAGSNGTDARVVDVLEWSAVPISVTTMGPYIASLLLSDRIQIHDMVSLSSLQEIALHTLSPASALHTTLGVSASALAALGGDVHADLTTRLLLMPEQPGTAPVDKVTGVAAPPRLYAMALTAHQKGMGSGSKVGAFQSMVGSSMSGAVSAASNIFKGPGSGGSGGGSSGSGSGSGGGRGGGMHDPTSGGPGAQAASPAAGVGGNVDSGVLCVARMVPLYRQVARLLKESSFEAAISVSLLGAEDRRTCATLTDTLGDGDGDDILREARRSSDDGSSSSSSLAAIRRAYAAALHGRGDFEGSVEQHMLANTTPLEVISKYTEFVPASLRAALKAHGISFESLVDTRTDAEGTGATKMLGGMLGRAAAAVAEVCEHFRRTGTGTSTGTSAGAGGGSAGRAQGGQAAWEATVVDSAYLCALLACMPPRRTAILELVSEPNCCYIDACSVALAAQGHAYIECLLWLYRSRGEHRRVIANLSESRCISNSDQSKKAGSRTGDSGGGVGGGSGVREMGRLRGLWDRVAFHAWCASYLTSLWACTANELDARPDTSAAGDTSTSGGSAPSSPARGGWQVGSVGSAAWPALVLSTLPALIEYDAAAALAVLCAHTSAQPWMMSSSQKPSDVAVSASSSSSSFSSASSSSSSPPALPCLQATTDVLTMLDACRPYASEFAAVPTNGTGTGTGTIDTRLALALHTLAVAREASTTRSSLSMDVGGVVGPSDAGMGAAGGLARVSGLSPLGYDRGKSFSADSADHANAHGSGAPASKAAYPLTDGRAMSLAFLEWLLLHSPYNVRGVKASGGSGDSGAVPQTALENMSLADADADSSGSGSGGKSSKREATALATAHKHPSLGAAGAAAGADVAADARALANLYVCRLLDIVPKLEEEARSEKGTGAVAQAGGQSICGDAAVLLPTETAATILFKIYRSKLQHFLSTTQAYDAAYALQLLPSRYLEECALILGRLGRHREALTIYYSRLAILPQALQYCHMVWQRATAKDMLPSARTSASASAGAGASAVEGGDVEQEQERCVYLYLLETILNPENPIPGQGQGQGAATQEEGASAVPRLDPRIHVAVAVAELFFQRLDASAFVAMLQARVGSGAKLQRLLLDRLNRFILLVQEYALASRRNLQVVHQLQRTLEVSVRLAAS